MVSRKQHLKRISALAADGKRVAKRARQSRQASSSPSNLDTSDHDNSINIIESQPQELANNSVADVESQCIEFSSESEEFDVEKSDIDDEESDSETEDELFDWGEDTDEKFSHQDPKIPPPPVLKRKMNLYRQDMGYATEEWQPLSSHQKPRGNGDLRSIRLLKLYKSHDSCIWYES